MTCNNVGELQATRCYRPRRQSLGELATVNAAFYPVADSHRARGKRW